MIAAAPAPRSVKQEQFLIYLRRIGPEGWDRSRNDSVLCALERDGLAEYRGTRARPRVEAWHATPAGAKWVEDARAAALAQDV